MCRHPDSNGGACIGAIGDDRLGHQFYQIGMTSTTTTTASSRHDADKKNCLAFVLSCKEHSAFMVHPVASKGAEVEWLLMVRVKDDVPWHEAGVNLLKSKVGDDMFTPPQVHNIVHLQTSRQGSWDRIVIFTSHLSKTQGDECICQHPEKNKKGNKWLPLSQLDIIKGEVKIWGPRLAKTLEAFHASPGKIGFVEHSTISDKKPAPERMTLCRRHKPNPSEHDMEIIINNDGSLVRRNAIVAGKVKEYSHPNAKLFNHLLTMVRECQKLHNGPKKGPDWYEDEDSMSKFHVPAIKSLLEKAKQAFKSEPRILKVQQPAHVLGDIHGNLSDIIHFEDVLWGPIPDIQASRFLFLGDYVDRGNWSVECVIYLFCMRLMHPGTFYLLRGNHEVKSLQVNFSFKTECVKKFKKGLTDRGVEIWNLFNETFDEMPIAALIDDKIFCAHGGIPASQSKIAALEQIPRSLSDPENQSDPAWEILWNDPVSKKEHRDILSMQRTGEIDADQEAMFKRGFYPNDKRGTAYLFLETAVSDFLLENNLSHVIRAHEMVKDGFQFHFEGKVITVFSSSNYQKNKNTAGCIMVADNRIRPIKIKQFAAPTRTRSR